MADLQIELKKPFPAQAKILKNRRRNNLLVLSRRYGKTSLGHYLVCRGSIERERTRTAWSSPTWKLMIQGWEDIIQILRPIIVRKSREDRRIELLNDSLIEFWSTDDPQAGRGRKYHRWVHDEAQRDRNLVKFFRGSARPTLADYKGESWVLGTANGEGSQFHEFYLECVGDPSWQVAHGRLEDNPYIDPEEIATMRRDLGPELAAQEIDSQWVRVDGITPLVRKTQWDLLYEEKENRSRTRALAIDASVKHDKTAIVACWLDELTDVTYVDYNDVQMIEPDPQTGEVDYEELEEQLWARWQTGRYHIFAYDPYQMVSLAQRLKRRGVRVMEFTQNSMRLKGDGLLRQLINQNKLRHPGHDMLTDHVLSATLKYVNEAFRLVKGAKDDKIDLAVALSMACWALNQTKAQAMQTYTPVTDAAMVPHLQQAQRNLSQFMKSGSVFDYIKGINPYER